MLKQLEETASTIWDNQMAIGNKNGGTSGANNGRCHTGACPNLRGRAWSAGRVASRAASSNNFAHVQPGLQRVEALLEGVQDSHVGSEGLQAGPT